MPTSDDLLKSLAHGFMPQEEMLEVARKKSSLQIGIPKETSIQEKRIPLVPDAVALLVNNGHEVIIETGAGEGCSFSDKDYSEAGAQIVYGTEEVYKANMILKVEPPTLEEIDMMQNGQLLISALQLPIQPKDFLKKLISKKITAVAFDFIKDPDGILPIVTAMSEIAGNTAILIAAEYLSNQRNGQGQMFGGISGVSPTEVVILGAGTVGEFAARTAVGLGASVKVFDNNIHKLRRLQTAVGQRLQTSIVQPKVLLKALKSADVVIGAISSKIGRAPIIVTEEMVKCMKDYSVIVDVSIDKGGCIETSEITSHQAPVFAKHGVIHYCVPNIASRVARTASYALSNVIAPTILDTGEFGGIEAMIRSYVGIQNGVYIYKGILTNKYLAETFNMPYKDINLLLMAM
ncbi:MAG: alanine dehydrogenase [Flavobacteriales bacterium]|jgi:alanine dehydrogenase|nr:alanine dehydrogenase [Flavobacteriales bacterium]MBQ20965.1 alanine dehydrogenase [Flavobacteriales bacterium]|tara:strand:- start:34091 stop:35305 length:1215 start_codon:yes stop_codon:yes gene_type:complete